MSWAIQFLAFSHPGNVRSRLSGEHNLQNQLSKAHRNSQRTKWKSQSLHRFSAYILLLLAWCFCGTTNRGSEGVPDSFTCFWPSFSPTRLTWPGLIWRCAYMLCLIQFVSVRGLLFSEIKWSRNGSGKERRCARSWKEWREEKLNSQIIY